jgi:hypothetical protein
MIQIHRRGALLEIGAKASDIAAIIKTGRSRRAA